MKALAIGSSALAAILACGAALTSIRHPPDIPYKTVSPFPGALALGRDLDLLEDAMRSLSVQLPQHAELAAAVCAQCQSARSLFSEQLRPLPGASVEFILWRHPASLGSADPSDAAQAERSFDLCSKLILSRRYQCVALEGASGAPRDDASVIAEEIRYRVGSPLARLLAVRGVDAGSPDQVRSFILNEAVAGRMLARHARYYELARRSSTPFVLCVSPSLDSLEYMVRSGLLRTPSEPDILGALDRGRSEYALACLLRSMRESGFRRGAIVFGFMHEPHFRALAARLGLESRIYNATGMEWGSWDRPDRGASRASLARQP